jgi:hypothetical protein
VTYPQNPSQPQLPPTQPGVPQSPYPQRPGPPAFSAPPMVVQQIRPSSTVAVWALVLGLIGLLFGWCMLGLPCLAAVILGHIAVADTKNDAKSGRGMAVAGLILGYVALAPAIIMFFWLVLGAGLSAVPGVGSTATPTP